MHRQMKKTFAVLLPTRLTLILTDKVVVWILLALTQCFLKLGKTVCFLLYTVFFAVYCFTKYNAL